MSSFTSSVFSQGVWTNTYNLAIAYKASGVSQMSETAFWLHNDFQPP